MTAEPLREAASLPWPVPRQAACRVEGSLLGGMQGLTDVQEDEAAVICDDDPAQRTCRTITACTSQQAVGAVTCKLLPTSAWPSGRHWHQAALPGSL